MKVSQSKRAHLDYGRMRDGEEDIMRTIAHALAIQDMDMQGRLLGAHCFVYTFGGGVKKKTPLSLVSLPTCCPVGPLASSSCLCPHTLRCGPLTSMARTFVVVRMKWKDERGLWGERARVGAGAAGNGGREDEEQDERVDTDIGTRKERRWRLR